MKTKTKKEWETLEAKSRAGIVSKLSDLLIKHQEKLALVMAEEIGKPLKAGRHEVLIASQRVKAFCEQIPEFIADEVVGDNLEEKNTICYEPVGTVAVISPWNAPVFLAMAGIIPPLLCGNKIIWKPSEHATKTGKVLAKIIKKLNNSGLPDKTFTVRYGGRSVGQKLVESDVSIVALTGSVRAGQAVMRASANKLHRLVLELGGKDPAIILPDADISKAAKEIVKSATMYSGQVCFGVERVYCHSKVYSKFVKACISEIKKINVGDPFDEKTDMGPMSVKFQYDIVLGHIKDALGNGAKLLIGGKSSGGLFIKPGIIVGVNHSMKIMREETFGPVIPIMKFSKIEQAIALANDSVFGLTASIWTRNIKLGEKIARQIEAGTVEINRHGMSKAGLPWGGYKLSGLGRIYSREGIRSAFTNIKHIWTVKNGR